MNGAVEQPKSPKVSAILISHNQATGLRGAVQALRQSQEGTNLEIIVVDSGSSEPPSFIETDFPGVIYLRLPQHFGMTRALNIGVRTAKSDLLLFVSPEIEIAPDAILHLVHRFESEPDAAAVCPLIVNSEGQPANLIYPLPDADFFKRACAGREIPVVKIDLSQDSVVVPYPGLECLLIRRHFIVGMNYFDNRFGEYWADADLALQVRRAQRKIHLYPGIRATRTQPRRTEPEDTYHVADRILGATVVLQKHYGTVAAMGFRVSQILNSLIRMRLGLFFALLSGTRVGAPGA
jgi:N-acetylglucosaminyl-diphospho-decaprenol L-rhamnosyltransferase